MVAEMRSQMENLLWSMIQESRVLQSYRNEIRGLWQDEAARDLTGRFLDPHENEDKRMLEALGQQNTALERAEERMENSANFVRTAEEYGVHVRDGLMETDQELQNCFRVFYRYAQRTEEAQSKFSSITALIHDAANACDI